MICIKFLETHLEDIVGHLKCVRNAKRENSNAEDSCNSLLGTTNKYQNNPTCDVTHTQTEAWCNNSRAVRTDTCGHRLWRPPLVQCPTGRGKRDRGSRAHGQRKTPRLDVLSTTAVKVRKQTHSTITMTTRNLLTTRDRHSRE